MLNEEQKVISASVLEVLAHDQEAQVNQVGEDRVSYFLNLANNTGEAEFKDAVRDWKESHKVEGKADKVIAVRASEFSALYWANRHNAHLTEMGYHAAIIHARKHLEKMGLRANGTPILSEDAKEANRLKTLKRKAAQEATKLVDFGAEDALIQFQAKTTELIAKMQADKVAESRIKKFEKITNLVTSIMDEGDDYAMEVFRALTNALGFDISEEAVLEEQQQQAA